MSLRPLVLFGAGGHALEVAQIVHDINAIAPRWQLLGTLVESDFVSGIGGGDPSLPVLGDAGWLDGRSDVEVVVAIGEPAVRRRIVRDLLAIPGRLVWHDGKLVRIELLSLNQNARELVVCLEKYCTGG